MKHRFSNMRGPRQLLFFQLLVLCHRSNRHSNSLWAHRMFKISSHKVSSILSNSEAEFWINCPPKVPSQSPTMRWLKAGIWGFGSAVRVQCHATLLASGLPACFTNLHTRWSGKIDLQVKFWSEIHVLLFQKVWILFLTIPCFRELLQVLLYSNRTTSIFDLERNRSEIWSLKVSSKSITRTWNFSCFGTLLAVHVCMCVCAYVRTYVHAQ